jgi:predicted RND superfamily exporter protein
VAETPSADGQSFRLAARAPWLALALLLPLTVAPALLLPSLIFDGSPEPLLPSTQRREALGIGPDLDGENGVVIGVFAADVFRPATLAKIDDLSSSLWHLDGVSTVVSPTTLLAPRPTADGVRMEPLLGSLPKTEEEAEAFRAALLAHPLAVGNVVAADGGAAAIRLHLAFRGAGARGRRALVLRIRELVAAAGGPETFAVAGRPAEVVETEDRLREQLFTATAAALVLVAAAALLALHSVRGTALPLAAALVAVLWTLGSMSAVQRAVDLCTVNLAPILALLAAVPAMVIVARHDRERARGKTARQATAAAMDALRTPLVLSALTTLLGVSAFAPSAFPALRAFGRHGGVGVAGMLAAWLLLVPAALSLLPGAAPARGASRRLTAALERLGAVLDRHRVALLLAGAVILAGAVVGTARLTVETGYLQYFDRQSPFSRDARRIAEKLGGSGAISIVIDGRQPRSIVRSESLRALADLQRFVAEQPGVDQTRSLIDYLKMIGAAKSPGAKADLPVRQEEIEALLDLDPAVLYDVADEKLSRTRIVVRTGVTDSEGMARLVDRIEAFASPKLLHRGLGKRALFPRGVSVRTMGVPVRLHRAAEVLGAEERRALGVLAAALTTITALFFLSLRVALVCLALDGAAVVALLGSMAWLGVPLTHAGAVLPPLVLGVAAGSTAHYLSAFGSSAQQPDDASADVVGFLGLPLAYGAAALALGFLALSLSPFPPSRFLGYAGALGVGITLAANALLLSTRVLRSSVITISDLLLLKVGRLEELPLFEGLRPFQSKIVMLTGRLASALPGEHIARRGEVKPELYVLISGRAEVRTGDGGPPIGNLRRGEVVGEMGLVREQPRSADVVAVENTEYLVIDGTFLERLRRQYPRIAAIVFRNLTRILSDRLERTTARLVELSARER